jgi:hypothetical protein
MRGHGICTSADARAVPRSGRGGASLGPAGGRPRRRQCHLNGTIVSQTQCREPTSQEAAASIFLPFIGMAFNQHNSKCR